MFVLKQIFDKTKIASKHNNIGPIGLELAMEKIHLVQLQREPSGKIHFRAKTSLPYSGSRDDLLASPKTMKALLKKALNSKPFSGRNIVTLMPTTDVRIMSVTYQVNKGQKEEEALLKLMANRIQGELSDYVIDYIPVRGKSSDEERLAVVAFAKRDRVISYLEALRKAGMNVDALEIGPSAIKRLISTISTAEDDENILVINFGFKKSYITLISGRRLLFDQEVDFGEEELLNQLSVLLDVSMEMARDLICKHGLYPNADNESESGIDFPESINEILKPMFMKLAREINRALIYTASETRGEPVKQVYLLGSIARWQGADKMLNLLVNIPVAIPNTLMMFESDTDSDSSQHADKVSEIAVATGLALRGVIMNA